MQICGVSRCGNSSPNGFFKINMLNRDESNSPDYQLECQRQRDWLNALNIRLQIVQNPSLYKMFEQRMYVCAKHFVSGQPAPLLDLDNIDWVPNLNLPKAGPEFSHDNDKNYKCKYCPQLYRSEDGVLRHMTSHTDDEKKWLNEGLNEVLEIDSHPDLLESKSILNKVNEKMTLFDWCTCAKCMEILKLLDEHLNVKHSNKDHGNIVDALSDHAYISSKKTANGQQHDIVDQAKVEETPVVKKICFKILKVNGKKMFACQFCGIQLANREDMFEHFKGHLTNVGDEQNIPPIIKETVLTTKSRPMPIPEEFQCAVCATVDSSRHEILDCVRQHVHSGWPKNNNSGLVWEMSETKSNGVADEDLLGKIALEYNASYTNNDPIYFRCMTCTRYFDNKDEFQKHLIDQHGHNTVIAIDHIVRVAPIVKCSNCTTDNGDFLSFVDIEAAMEHRKLHHFGVIGTASPSIQRLVINSDESEVLWHGECVYFEENCISQNFQCPCQKLYTFKTSALKCLAQHVGIRRFRCQEDNVKFQGKKCWVAFFSSHDLAQHIEKFHRLESEDCIAICHICGKLCKREILGAHMRQAHRKYKCKQCGRSYENNYKLTAHIAGVHKRIKKFRCSECNESYIWKTGAIACETRHRKNHRCEYCDQVFPRLYQKIGHVAECHPMFSSGFDGADKIGADFNFNDFNDFNDFEI